MKDGSEHSVLPGHQPASSGGSPPVERARGIRLYPRWANAAFRLALIALVLAIIGVPSFFIAWARTSYATGASTPLVQPILFDHRHHVRDDGIDCRYCHFTVTRSAYAGVPPTAVCMNCHSQVWGHAPILAIARDSYYASKAISWPRVFNVPDFVFFNHAVHVKRNVGCVTCHGRIDLMAQPFMPQAMTMRWCLDCHRAPENHLRPIERSTDMEWIPERPQLELGMEIKLRNHINPPTHCSGCHR